MALTKPSTNDLYAFWGDESSDEDITRATQFIDLATNMFYLDSGMVTDPTDPQLASLVKLAILDLAMYLIITRDDVDANYSPFFSERVGSYTYSKAYSISTQSSGKAANVRLGIYDRVMEYLSELAMGNWVTSEQIFHYGYQPLYLDAWMLHPGLWGSNLFSSLDRFQGANADDEGTFWDGTAVSG